MGVSREDGGMGGGWGDVSQTSSVWAGPEGGVSAPEKAVRQLPNGLLFVSGRGMKIDGGFQRGEVMSGQGDGHAKARPSAKRAAWDSTNRVTCFSATQRF